MSVTAKSVILDIADIWGGGGRMGIRSVEFKLAGSLVTINSGNVTCYATTWNSPLTGGLPDYAFYTSLSKTGSSENNGWYSDSSAITNQRLICVFSSPIEFDEIIINNFHSSGASTDYGGKNVKVYRSSDSITSTVYGETIANSSLLFDGQFTQHVSSNVVDDQVVYGGTEVVVSPAFSGTSVMSMAGIARILHLSPFSQASELSAGALAASFVEGATLSHSGEISGSILFDGDNSWEIPDFSGSGSLDSNINIKVQVQDLSASVELSSGVYTGLVVAIPDPGLSADSSIASTIFLGIAVSDFNLTGSISANPTRSLTSIPALSAIAEIASGGVVSFSYANPSILFFFTLTGAPDGLADIQIPIKSFQARHRSGKPSFLSVTIPGTDYSDDITARPNGELVIRMAKSHAGAIYHSEEILRASFDEPRPDDGGHNKSITLSGYGTSTFSPKSVALQGVVYRSGSAGKLRFRLATPDIFLRPGDTASYAGDEILVDTISYTIDAKRQRMELAE